DPDAALATSARTAVENDLRAIRQRGESATTDAAREQVVRDYLDLRRRAQALPRGIVMHPALSGRELAWSVARVDFWFNQLDLIGKEAAAINGGAAMPTQFKRSALD